MKKATDNFRLCRIETYRRKQLEHLPNIITFLRFPLSIAMLVVSPFSALFWIFYLDSGLTDILDGFLARKLHLESTIGAKPDSLADFVFVECLTIFAVINMNIPRWLWLCALAIALLRFVSYGIGFNKYHAFTALHTWANKLTGILIFAAPILYCLCGLRFTGIILCAVAFISACEELVIIIISKELNRDCMGILCGKSVF